MKPADLVLGGRYNWKNQPERLVYLGVQRYPDRPWHQFARVDQLDKVWCEVTDSDLESFEASAPDNVDPSDRALLVNALHALMEHERLTRPIHTTTEAINALLARLGRPTPSSVAHMFGDKR